MTNMEIYSAEDLVSLPVRKTKYLVDGLIPNGLSILSGAPKVGKSWMMLWLSLRISQGKDVWGMKTNKCDVLYMSLEDPFHRIQERLFDIAEDVSDNLYFTNGSDKLNNGFQAQIYKHMDDHPETGLIIIDTLQKIKSCSDGNAMSYADDYETISTLKKIADRYRIGIIVIHHLRKMKDKDDPFNQISGTNGLAGAADSIFVLTKEQRVDDTAVMIAVGRDIEQQELHLRFEDKRWHMIEHKGQQELKKESIPPVLTRIAEFVLEVGHWEGTATELLSTISDSEASPVTITKLISKFYYEVFEPLGITYETKRKAKERIIKLTANDRCDGNDR